MNTGKEMTIKELANWLNEAVKQGMGDEPIRINGKAILSIKSVGAKDGEPAYMDLKDTRPDTSKMQKVMPRSSYKITKLD